MYLSFKTTMTRAGAQRRAEALTGAPTAQWTEVVLGDADNNGAGPRTYFPPIDEETGYTTQTQLVHPVWEGEIDSLQIGEDGHTLVLNFIVPKDVGAFFFTEIAVRDENGNLLFIGTAAEAQYKPRLIPVNDGAAVFSFTISMTGDSTLKIKGEKGDRGEKGEKGDQGLRGQRGFTGYGNAWLKDFDDPDLDDVVALENEQGVASVSVDGIVGNCLRVLPANVSFAGEDDRGYSIKIPLDSSSFLRGHTTRFQIFAKKEESGNSRFAFSAKVGSERSPWQYRILTDDWEPYYFDWDVPTNTDHDLEIVVVAGIDGERVHTLFDLVAASTVSTVVDDEDSAHFEATITRKLLNLGIRVEDEIATKLSTVETRTQSADDRITSMESLIEKMEQDLDGEHNLGGEFNFGLARDLKQWREIAIDDLERDAMSWRSKGQSGLIMMKQYSFCGDAAYHRPSAVNFSAIGIHDHSNYPAMSGMPEMQVVINGYPLHTRHTDYRWLQNVDGNYLDYVDADRPPVPPEVTSQPTVAEQTTEMQRYYRALGNWDDSIFPGYRQYTDVHVAYLETWFETITGPGLVDAIHSFRHEFDSDNVDEMHERMIAYSMTGLRSLGENGSFVPRIVRVPDNRGNNTYAVMRYRVLTKKLGNLDEWPVDKMVSLHDDPTTRLRSNLRGERLADHRMARFRVNHGIDDSNLLVRNRPSLLDEIMSKIPGLDGPSAFVNDVYIDGGLTTYIKKYGSTTEDLNAGFYNRWYSHPRGAAGRTNAQRGFNDPTLYVSRTTRPEVTSFGHQGFDHRVSYAIPLELVLATPYMSWNPYGIFDFPNRADIFDGGSRDGTTPEKALLGTNYDYYWNLTPEEFYSTDVGTIDPADTRSGAWILDKDDVPRLVRSSGVYTFAMPIPECPQIRLRYPIVPVHHEGSFEYGYTQAQMEETAEVQAASIREILEFKEWAREASKVIDDLKNDQEEYRSLITKLMVDLGRDISDMDRQHVTADQLNNALEAAFDQHEAEDHA